MVQDSQPLQPIIFAAEKPALEFPKSHHLVLITEKRVLCLDASGLSHIFTSSSSCILAAKKAKDGRGTLAIADGQVVVLHGLDKGGQTYRLKRTDVCP